jgi:methionyl-tRNA formyltransferase
MRAGAFRPGDTAATLWRRDLAPMGLALFDQVLVRLKEGDSCEGVTQDAELATWEPAWTPQALACM